MSDIAFLFCTFIVSMSCAIYFRITRKLQNRQSLYLYLITINIGLSAAFSLISNFIENTTVATGYLFFIQYSSQLILFALHQMLSPLYTMYVMMVNGIGLNKNNKFFSVLMAPFAVVELLILTNPLNGFIFSYDRNSNFVRGPLESVTYIVALFYLLVSFHFLAKYRHAISKKTTFSLIYFFAITIVGVVVQFFVPFFKLELFAESISTLGVMLSIETNNDNLEPSTRVYNRQAFAGENVRLIHTGQSYAVITIGMTNIRFFQRMLNYAALNEVMSNIADWLKSLSNDIRVFRAHPDNFSIIYLYSEPVDVDILVKKIADKFTEGWMYDTALLQINTVIKVAMIPQDFTDPDFILELTDINSDVEKNGVTILRSADLESITRRALIEHALRNALDEDLFEVYYQPIIDMDEKKIISAEALLRLNDPALGYIPPDEFIPIAEQNGLISDIGIAVFEKACSFLADERTKSLGLNYLEINLSVYQLIVGNTISKFKELMDEYGISPKQINLEITETGSIGDSNSLKTAIEELKRIGFAFSLDDYGTGYSNLTYIISMDFQNIKSDKGLLWNSDNNDDSKILITDTIQMMRRLGFNVIQEGVETKEQLDLVVDAGANLIQGYYFSKPIPKEEFLRFVKNFSFEDVINK